MAKHSEMTFHITDPVTDEFDAWVASLRLLVSQIGFAFDTYLAKRPPLDSERTPVAA